MKISAFEVSADDLTYVWGGDVTTAAVAHVAGRAHPEALMHASVFNDGTKQQITINPLRSERGQPLFVEAI